MPSQGILKRIYTQKQSERDDHRRFRKDKLLNESLAKTTVMYNWYMAESSRKVADVAQQFKCEYSWVTKVFRRHKFPLKKKR
jgi:hypothetical protein